MKIEFNSPVPLPAPDFYENHFKSYEEDIESMQNQYNRHVGAPEVTFDAWVDVTTTTVEAGAPMQASTGLSTLQHRFLRLSQLGRSFETPLDEDDEDSLVAETSEKPDGKQRPYYRNQYAFAQGYLQQQYVIDRMYDGVDFDTTFEAVRNKMNEGLSPDLGEMIPLYIYNQRVRAIGTVGIAAMGYAQNIIERWSHEVYPYDTKDHSDSRNAFMQGHGVALESSRMYHQQVNDVLITGLRFDELNPADINLNADTTRDTE